MFVTIGKVVKLIASIGLGLSFILGGIGLGLVVLIDASEGDYVV